MAIRKQLKRGKVRWVADYVDATGQRRQKFFRTREEAKQHHARAVVGGGQRVRCLLPPDITFKDYADRWRASMHEVRPHTAAIYGSVLERHLVPAFGPMRVREVADFTLLLEWAARQRLSFARATVKLILAVLRLILRRALKEGVIMMNPVSDVVRELALVTKRNRQQPRDGEVMAFTADEVRRLLAMADTVEPHYAPMWRVQVLTGLRPGEVAGLHVGDVLDDDKTTVASELWVRRTVSPSGKDAGPPKTSESYRQVQMTPDLRRFVEGYLLAKGLRATPDAVMFPAARRSGYSPSAVIAGAFKRALRAASLPTHFTPHCLRHTFASLHLANGTDLYWVSRQMGHADIRLTVNVYGHWLRPKRPEALATMDRLLAGPAPIAAREVAA